MQECVGMLFYTTLLYKQILLKCHFQKCEICMLHLITNKKLATQLEKLILL